MTARDFWVPGVPATKGSWRVNAGGKGVRPDNKREKAWAATVGWSARAWMVTSVPRHKIIRGALAVCCMFALPEPANASHGYPSRGDLDKLARSVLDALSGIVYVDDRQVTELIARKSWATQPRGPGVLILVTEAA